MKKYKRIVWWAVQDQDGKIMRITISPSQRQAFDKLKSWKGLDVVRALFLDGKWEFCRVLIQKI